MDTAHRSSLNIVSIDKWTNLNYSLKYSLMPTYFDQLSVLLRNHCPFHGWSHAYRDRYYRIDNDGWKEETLTNSAPASNIMSLDLKKVSNRSKFEIHLKYVHQNGKFGKLIREGTMTKCLIYFVRNKVYNNKQSTIKAKTVSFV